jgi:hypothetical protein
VLLTSRPKVDSAACAGAVDSIITAATAANGNVELM